MAHGAPDYWSLPISGLPVPSVYQTVATGVGVANIAGGGFADLAAYLVPPNQRLYIACGKITTNGPGIHSWQWVLDGLAGLIRYFDTETSFPLNPSAMNWIDAGRTLEIRINNLDTVAWNFHVEWFGFEVAVVPDIRIPAGFTGFGVAIAGAGV